MSAATRNGPTYLGDIVVLAQTLEVFVEFVHAVFVRTLGFLGHFLGELVMKRRE